MVNLENYKVMALSQGAAYSVMEGSYNECLEFCQENNWELFDENEFLWDLEIF